MVHIDQYLLTRRVVIFHPSADKASAKRQFPNIETSFPLFNLPYISFFILANGTLANDDIFPHPLLWFQFTHQPLTQTWIYVDARPKRHNNAVIAPAPHGQGREKTLYVLLTNDNKLLVDFVNS
jgi:hypothetical protein